MPADLSLFIQSLCILGAGCALTPSVTTGKSELEDMTLFGEENADRDYLPHGSVGHRDTLETVKREDVGSEVWDIHAEVCRRSSADLASRKREVLP